MQMDIKILEKKKARLRFSLKGEGHMMANLLRTQLWKQKNVKTAAYSIKHPLLAVPEMLVETSAGDAKDAVIKSAEAIKKQNKEFLTQFKKKVK